MKDSFRMDLARFLKNKRMASGLSQIEVAEKLGYSTSQFVSNWERGVASPPVKTLRRLATMYKIPVKEIYNLVLRITLQKAQTDLQREFYGDIRPRPRPRSRPRPRRRR